MQAKLQLIIHSHIEDQQGFIVWIFIKLCVNLQNLYFKLKYLHSQNIVYYWSKSIKDPLI